MEEFMSDNSAYTRENGEATMYRAFSAAVSWLLRRSVLSTASVAVPLVFAAVNAHASPIPLGFISYDVTIPGSFAQFDITNETGVNSTFPPDPTFPVDTAVSFSNLSLTVEFSDGSTSVFGSSYFTPTGAGSFNGGAIAIGGSLPDPIMATLTGHLSPTLLDVAGTPTSVSSTFDAAVIVDSPLQDGDLAIINAERAAAATVPEPSTLTLLLGGCIMLLYARPGRKRRGSRLVGSVLVLALGILPTIATADTSVKQNATTTPSTGVAGVGFVNITASGVPEPAATISPGNVTVKLAPTCTVGATGPVAGEIDAIVTSVKPVLGSTDRFNFQLPSALAQGTYFAQLFDTTNGFEGGNCSIVTVTKTTAALNACVPTSSLGVVAGTNVTAFVPNGWWGGTHTGITAVPLEGSIGSNTPISTSNVVNSCAGNPATGQVVCTANNTDVYLISGSPPALDTTLSSGLNGSAFFSGGTCQNCGVAINALNNTAAINGGLSSSPSGNGIQILNLNTNTFNPAFATNRLVSENISIDPGRGLILSPNENSNYMLLSTNSAGAITGEFDQSISSGFGEPDSAAEDCSTGVALSSDEFTNNVYLANLAAATFTSGSPGSWTAPSTLFSFTNSGSFSSEAGISGIAVAQGSSHLAFVAGEFGGNLFGVMQLQDAGSLGSSAPQVIDHVTFALPPTPDGNVFQNGCDPHTMTAYTSPNTGLAYGVAASWVPLCFSDGTPAWLAVVDLAKTLDPVQTPRVSTTGSGSHAVSTGVDLLANGNVRYVKVQ